MKPVSLASILALCIVVCPTVSIYANGYHYPELGTAALGRGGTFVARADDPTALYFNPAGAARLRGTRILLDTNLVFESIRFQRQFFGGTESRSGYPHDPTRQMPLVRNTNGPFPIPFLAVTSDLGGMLRPLNLTLLAGIYGPHAHPSHTFPRFCDENSASECKEAISPDGNPRFTNSPNPIRYETLSTSILVLYPSLGLAWQPIPNLSVGAVLQLAWSSLSYKTVVGATLGENPATDIDVALDYTSNITPTGIFGIHWAPVRWLEIGASVRMGFTLDMSGDVHTSVDERFGDEFGGVEIDITPNPAISRFEIPKATIVKTGIRYAHFDQRNREQFDIELDFYWENTSVLQSFDLAFNLPGQEEGIKINFKETGTTIAQLNDVSVEHKWRDSYSLRLGGAYRGYNWIEGTTMILRAGGFFESSAMPDQYTRLDFISLDRFGLTLGAGIRFGRFQFDVGLAYLFHLSRTVQPDQGIPPCEDIITETCGSDVRAIVPLLADQRGPPVGNGRVNVGIMVLSAGAKVFFDP